MKVEKVSKWIVMGLILSAYVTGAAAERIPDTPFAIMPLSGKYSGSAGSFTEAQALAQLMDLKAQVGENNGNFNVGFNGIYGGEATLARNCRLARDNNMSHAVIINVQTHAGPSSIQNIAAADFRNYQWRRDGVTWEGDDPTDNRDWQVVTPSRYATTLRAKFEDITDSKSRPIKRVMDDYPGIIISVNACIEEELAVRGQATPFLADYSPFAITEFRDWLCHTGMYDADTGAYPIEGAPAEIVGSFVTINGKLRSPFYDDPTPADSNGTGTSFNGKFGTGFSTWTLRNWDLTAYPSPITNPAFDPTPSSGTGYTAGGFDAPRAVSSGNAFWRAWSWDFVDQGDTFPPGNPTAPAYGFRQTMIRNFVNDVLLWIEEEGIPRELITGHQIPAEMLFSDARSRSSASPVWSGLSKYNGTVGITRYGTINTTQMQYITQYTDDWGIYEWHPKKGETDETVLKNRTMQELEKYYDNNCRIISPFTWNGGVRHPTYPVSNSGVAEGLKAWLAEKIEEEGTAEPAPTYGNSGTPGTGDPWPVTRSATTRIESENYDQGDAEIVYSDTTAGNTGGAYRTDDVDISSTSDSGGGHNVGWTKAGEWLQYTVDVAQAGLYDITFRYSRLALENSALNISMNGAYLPGTIDAPGTGDWGTYTTITKTFELQAGIQALRLHFVDGSVNVNWLELAAGVTPVVTLTTLNEPVFVDVASTWSDGLPAHGGADYVVPTTGNLKSLDGTSSFPGFSLTVEGGGKFQFRGKQELGEKTTVNGLIATGGTAGTFVNLAAGTGNNTVNHLDGTLVNDGYTALSGYGNSTGPRNIRISSLVSGTGTLQSTGTAAYPHTCTIANTNNTFDGVWESKIGTLAFESGSAVGAADIGVSTAGKLRISSDWISTATLTVADSATAEVELASNDWTVSNLVFAASTIPEGAYTATELNAFGANAVFTGTGTIRVGTPLPPPVIELIAGWDTWDSGASQNANVVATNVTGSAVTTSEDPTRPWHTTDERGASDDGTWGTHVGPPGADTTVGPDTADNLNLELPNAVTSGTITFAVANNGSSDIELNAFHADLLAFRSKAARTYVLSVLAGGGITPSTIYTSGAQEIHTTDGVPPDNDSHDDVDHSLLGLADHTLAAGESVQFRLTFSGGAGDASGGHDLWVDNVGITGAFPPTTEPPISPVLDLSMTDGNMVFNWSGGGFKVQTRTNLTEGTWQDVTGGDISPVTNSTTDPAAFFRLLEE